MLMESVVVTAENFPKAYRYTIGARMQTLAVDIMQGFARAYLTRDKESSLRVLDGMIADTETLKTLIALSGEKRWIYGKKRYGLLLVLVSDVAKQASALRNGIQERLAGVRVTSEQDARKAGIITAKAVKTSISL
jgi:hypothetical protein